jgi:hypothetical protein
MLFDEALSLFAPPLRLVDRVANAALASLDGRKERLPGESPQEDRAGDERQRRPEDRSNWG